MSRYKFEKIDPLNPLSYKTIRNTLYEWRRSGGKESNFNRLDQPGHLFFKILFHFWNGDTYAIDSSMGINSGLLAPSWMTLSKDNTQKTSDIKNFQSGLQSVTDKIMQYQNNGEDFDINQYETEDNSAYNYLLRNDELERAEKLQQFIMLLSNISTYSPWYFSEIAGLDAILERPFKRADEYKLEEEKQITIKCMPDSMDNRIATLVELYKDVAYSHIWHREVLPTNLRKFDMSIYIFDSSIVNLHHPETDSYAIMDEDRFKNETPTTSNEFPVSYKCIELHDCEFDYNLNKSGYSSLKNDEGFQQTFEIPIYVGNAFEHRYNAYMDRTIGDLVALDMKRCVYSSQSGKIFTQITDTPQSEYRKGTTKLLKDLDDRINILKMLDDLTGNYASDFVKSQTLGNIYKMSLNDLKDVSKNLVKNIKSGNLGAIKDDIKKITNVKNGWYFKDLGSLKDRITLYNK